VAVAGAYRVALDALGGDPRAAAALQRLVDAEQERSARHKGGDQQPQQHAADGQPGPRGAAEDAMVAVELPHLGAAGHAQGSGDGTLRRSEDRSCQQHLRVLPPASGKQRRKTPQDGYHQGG